jgi:16S rRNA (uracil1498-N3)-methyltransferase
MAVAPQMNDRFHCFLEKATEIGIHEITPILCDRSERKVINNEV